MVCTALRAFKAVKHSPHLQVLVNPAVKGNTKYFIEDSIFDFCQSAELYSCTSVCPHYQIKDRCATLTCGFIESPLVSLWRAKERGRIVDVYVNAWEEEKKSDLPAELANPWASPDHFCLFSPASAFCFPCPFLFFMFLSASCFKSCFGLVLYVKERQASNRTVYLSITNSFTEQSNWNIRSKLMITFTVRCQS